MPEAIKMLGSTSSNASNATTRLSAKRELTSKHFSLERAFKFVSNTDINRQRSSMRAVIARPDGRRPLALALPAAVSGAATWE